MDIWILLSFGYCNWCCCEHECIGYLFKSIQFFFNLIYLMLSKGNLDLTHAPYYSHLGDGVPGMKIYIVPLQLYRKAEYQLHVYRHRWTQRTDDMWQCPSRDNQTHHSHNVTNHTPKTVFACDVQGLIITIFPVHFLCGESDSTLGAWSFNTTNLQAKACVFAFSFTGPPSLGTIKKV